MFESSSKKTIHTYYIKNNLDFFLFEERKSDKEYTLFAQWSGVDRHYY